jgi:hypothetical protein
MGQGGFEAAVLRPTGRSPASGSAEDRPADGAEDDASTPNKEEPMTQRKPARRTRTPKPKALHPPSLSPALVVEEVAPRPLYTLPQLVERLGLATPEEVFLYVGRDSKIELTDLGRRVATPRVSKDSARLMGQAVDYYDQADEDQLDALAGIDPDFLRVGVWAAAEDERLCALHTRGRKSASQRRSTFGVSYSELRDRAIGRREQIHGLLVKLSGNDPVQLKAIEDAYGTSGNPQALNDSLLALVGLGRDYLADPSPEMVQRRQRSRLREALLADVEALTARMLNQGLAAQAVANLPPVTQSEVDYWDGVALWFLRRIIEAFDAARLTDPRVPRLLAIATRGVLGLYRPRDTDETPKPTQGDGSQTGAPQAGGIKASGTQADGSQSGNSPSEAPQAGGSQTSATTLA